MIASLVDEHLRQARALLGAGGVGVGSAPPTRSMPPHPASWSGPASERAVHRGGQLAADRGALLHSSTELQTVLAHAPAISAASQAHIAAVESAWQSDKRLIGTQGTATAEGRVALLAAARHRIAEAGAVVEAAARNYRQAAGEVMNAQRGLPAPLPEGQVPHPRPPEPQSASLPYCYTGTEDGPLGNCSLDTTDITYWDSQGRYVHKDLTAGAIEIIGPPGNPTDTNWHSEVCYLPSEDADRTSICDPDTTEWIFPRGDRMISVPSDSGGRSGDIPPGTPLAP